LRAFAYQNHREAKSHDTLSQETAVHTARPARQRTIMAADRGLFPRPRILHVLLVIVVAFGRAQLCSNNCGSSTFNVTDDGDCDDGGPGSAYDTCPYGTDCADCGPQPQSPAPPPASPGFFCSDTCNYHYVNDGYCEDGGPNSTSSNCEYGTDCTDCGPRSLAIAPSPPPPSSPRPSPPPPLLPGQLYWCNNTCNSGPGLDQCLGIRARIEMAGNHCR
jgi:hypothetical protein